MKKIILTAVFALLLITVWSQASMQSELTNFNERTFMVRTTYISRIIVGDLRINGDGRNINSLSVGYNLTGKSQRATLALMPGVAHHVFNGDLFYSAGVFYTGRETRITETKITLKWLQQMKARNGYMSFDGQIMINAGKRAFIFKVGPQLMATSGQRKFVEGAYSIVKNETYTFAGARGLLQLRGKVPLAFTGTMGWQWSDVMTKATGNAPMSVYVPEKRNGPSYSIGVLL